MGWDGVGWGGVGWGGVGWGGMGWGGVGWGGVGSSAALPHTRPAMRSPSRRDAGHEAPLSPSASHQKCSVRLKATQSHRPTQEQGASMRRGLHAPQANEQVYIKNHQKKKTPSNKLDTEQSRVIWLLRVPISGWVGNFLTLFRLRCGIFLPFSGCFSGRNLLLEGGHFAVRMQKEGWT